MTLQTERHSPPRAPHHLPVIGSLMAIGAGFVWSLGVITAKKSPNADAWQYLIWRSIGVILAVEIMSLVRGKGLVTPKAYNSGRSMLVGCFCLWLASVAFVYALKTTTAANAAFLSSISPLIAVIFARIFLGERLNRVTIGAIGVALCGLASTVTSDLSAGNMLGNIGALLSAVGFAGYTVCVRTDRNRDWSPVLPGYAFFMILICSAVTIVNGRPLFPSAHDVVLAFIHGAVFIVIGTTLFNLGSRTVTAVALSIFALSEFVFAPIWGYLFANETPKALTLVGGAIVLVAVVAKAILDARPTFDS
jgi:drug/metabolite transporter, DME family